MKLRFICTSNFEITVGFILLVILGRVTDIYVTLLRMEPRRNVNCAGQIIAVADMITRSEVGYSFCYLEYYMRNPCMVITS